MEKHSVDRREYLSDIIAASLLDNLDDKGERDLNEWLEESPLNRDFYESLKRSFSSGELLSRVSVYDPVADWVLVKQKIAKRRRRTIYRNRTLYAAAVTGVLVLLSVLFVPFSDKGSSDLGLSSDAPAAAIKENYTALLILPDGDMLDLGEKLELNDGKIKNDGTLLEYNSLPAEEAVREEPRIHTLKVPRGAEYKVVLSDGSTVHLNADSELRYPERFDGGDRTVELSGEAWFDVSHDSEKPFVVRNGDMRLEVLGTRFDFRCYAAEPRAATLESGRLRVVKGTDAIEIDPGDQVYEGNDALQTRTVDAAEYTAWRDKRFVYRSSSLGYVMNDIARWYDMDIEFRDASAMQTRLTANIPRYEDVESVLNIIGEAVYADIKMEGGVISVFRE